MIRSTLTSEQAEAAKELIQADYVAKEISGTISAVVGQVDAYFVVTIPTARVEEFTLGDNDKKNKFAIITANANAEEYKGVAFVDAWNLEYDKIYG